VVVFIGARFGGRNETAARVGGWWRTTSGVVRYGMMMIAGTQVGAAVTAAIQLHDHGSVNVGGRFRRVNCGQPVGEPVDEKEVLWIPGEVVG
jgi:hypothetical protein